MADPLESDAPSCHECGWPLPAELARCAGCNYPDPIPVELSGRHEASDWPVIGCGGWMQGLKKIPPSLPCGRENPQHYREYHPEIALLHRALHDEWTRQIEALEQLWAVS